jgi:hypothetical protein
MVAPIAGGRQAPKPFLPGEAVYLKSSFRMVYLWRAVDAEGEAAS